MNQKQLHRLWTKIRVVRPWYFLAIALVTGMVAVAALRQNNLHMIELRAQVVKADKENADVESALRQLRQFVYGHMNTDLASGRNGIRPPIQLQYRYDRLVAAEKKRVTDINAQVQTAAEAACKPQVATGVFDKERVACIQRYVSDHGAKQQSIPAALYKFDFASPRWSPDLAGVSLLISLVLLVLFGASYGLERWVRSELKE